MKAFDAHSDMFTDITIRRLKGERNIIENYHIDELKKGGVAASILGIWIEPLYVNKDRTWRTLQIMGAVSEEIEDMREYAGIVYKYSDLIKLNQENRIGIIMGMEGVSGLRDDISLINAMYRFGVRHAMLTWNEENEFATGVKSSNKDRGLTKKGVELVKRMEKLGIIIDVSHGNESTFWDIYENTTKPFIASHSNAYNLCNSIRNLKDDQIKAIGERNGVIGVNSWVDFVDNEHPCAEKLADHVDYIVDKIGIDHVGFGFDFGNYLDSRTLKSLQDEEYIKTQGIEDASKIPNLLNILKRRGYKNDELEKIAFKNMERIVRDILV
ncbi:MULTISPECIES: dipeptidase [Clostridium]|uniref:Membrane dipeptidase (Peptidase family M19) n=2 Tax=Clostridium TaxID=1485 RepID=D8GRD9_CLOLD|nr:MULTISPECIES: membrane dipeptidase [Clostridium]ADK14277.1 predicted dipeptidase [Clostridium ljungdahlii DSM 13528]OAA86054.1 Membrane dipeptidase (Peptidase family M19) [Clostridium coskatii]OAA88302.1 Membrane dipeptidase (Peptidase family M19) [Clostridium ljungdahlii DSM 13528]OBR91601.1 membrane dipeptidase (peptidase family M19) [Clostridium coskatii]